MEYKISKKLKGVTIVEGFPGFGLVGTIATEFLIDHLKFDKVGKIWSNDIPSIAAIHKGEVVEPMGLFYNKKYNILLIHGITAVNGLEWQVADTILKIAKETSAKKIVCLEGVGSPTADDKPKSFFWSNKDSEKKKLGKCCEVLREGIIMGVTGALMMRNEKYMQSAIFADTHTKLPDSKAAAKIIEVLDKYIGLKVDYKPLLKQAEVFEEKLKGLVQQAKGATDMADKKRLNYVG